jgi:hypothetical protein
MTPALFFAGLDRMTACAQALVIRFLPEQRIIGTAHRNDVINHRRHCDSPILAARGAKNIRAEIALRILRPSPSVAALMCGSTMLPVFCIGLLAMLLTSATSDEFRASWCAARTFCCEWHFIFTTPFAF